jgi:hypothetical protein
MPTSVDDIIDERRCHNNVFKDDLIGLIIFDTS